MGRYESDENEYERTEYPELDGVRQCSTPSTVELDSR